MSSGPSNVTSTTTTQPPAFLQPVMQGLGGLIGQPFGFGQDISPFPDNFSNQDRRRFGKLQNLRQKGKRFGKQAELEAKLGLSPGGVFGNPQTTNFDASGLGEGGGLGADSIFTSLDNQFNRAADLTRNRLTSEFAGSGRDIGASAPARSDELQTLAASIFSPSNMLQFDPLNLAINRLAGLIPGAGGSTQSSQPVFRTGLF